MAAIIPFRFVAVLLPLTYKATNFTITFMPLRLSTITAIHFWA